VVEVVYRDHEEVWLRRTHDGGALFASGASGNVEGLSLEDEKEAEREKVFHLLDARRGLMGGCFFSCVFLFVVVRVGDTNCQYETDDGKDCRDGPNVAVVVSEQADDECAFGESPVVIGRTASETSSVIMRAVQIEEKARKSGKDAFREILVELLEVSGTGVLGNC
jgi:hypothetical protein